MITKRSGNVKNLANTWQAESTAQFGSINQSSGVWTVGPDATNVSQLIKGALNLQRNGAAFGVQALSTSGAGITRDFAIINMGNGNTTSNAVGIFATVTQLGVAGAGATYDCSWEAHYSAGGVFNTLAVVARTGTTFGAPGAPTISWQGAGDQRTARLSLNQTFASYIVTYYISDRAAALVTFAP